MSTLGGVAALCQAASGATGQGRGLGDLNFLRWVEAPFNRAVQIKGRKWVSSGKERPFVGRSCARQPADDGKGEEPPGPFMGPGGPACIAPDSTPAPVIGYPLLRATLMLKITEGQNVAGSVH